MWYVLFEILNAKVGFLTSLRNRAVAGRWGRGDRSPPPPNNLFWLKCLALDPFKLAGNYSQKSWNLISEILISKIVRGGVALTWAQFTLRKLTRVWTKKTANKNPLPSVSGCIAFVQSLLRLVTSIELLQNACSYIPSVKKVSPQNGGFIRAKSGPWYVTKHAFYIY